MRNGTCLWVLLVLAACNQSEQQKPIITDSTRVIAADTARAAAPRANLTGITFDAGAVKDGDKVGELIVTRHDIAAAPASPLGVTGSVAFQGEVQLTGGYRAHYEYPEVNEACFWVDPTDWTRLPRARSDDRIKWFCFENQEQAVRQLGALGTETRATIVIADYTTNLRQSDVWDTARLVRVVRKQKTP